MTSTCFSCISKNQMVLFLKWTSDPLNKRCLDTGQCTERLQANTTCIRASTVMYSLAQWPSSFISPFFIPISNPAVRVAMLGNFNVNSSQAAGIFQKRRLESSCVCTRPFCMRTSALAYLLICTWIFNTLLLFLIKNASFAIGRAEGIEKKQKGV